MDRLDTLTLENKPFSCRSLSSGSVASSWNWTFSIAGWVCKGSRWGLEELDVCSYGDPLNSTLDLQTFVDSHVVLPGSLRGIFSHILQRSLSVAKC